MPQDTRVGVGTAILLLNKNQDVLLMVRKGRHLSGHVAAPGGWLDYEDASGAHGAAREAEEELGVKIDPNKLILLFVTHEHHDEIGRATVTLYYLANEEAGAFDGQPQIREPEKCERIFWHPFDLPLPTPHYPGMQFALKAIHPFTVDFWLDTQGAAQKMKNQSHLALGNA